MPIIFNNNTNPNSVVLNGTPLDKVYWMNEEVWPNTNSYSTTLYSWYEPDNNNGYVLHLSKYQLNENYIDRKQNLSGQYRPNWTQSTYGPLIHKVIIDDDIYPRSTFNWFRDLTSCTEWEHFERIHMNYTQYVDSMFSGDSQLTTINTSSIFTDSVITNNNSAFDNMFGGCSSLVEINVSHFKFTSSTTIKQMFAYCSNLENIIGLENWDLSNMTNLYGLFMYTKLSELILPNWDFGANCNCSYMFSGCTSIERIDLSGVSSLGDCSNMFNGCNSLQYLDLSNLDASDITNSNYMFVDCGNVQTAYCKSLADKTILDSIVNNSRQSWAFTVKE